jgi:hypothetical protein
LPRPSPPAQALEWLLSGAFLRELADRPLLVAPFELRIW